MNDEDQKLLKTVRRLLKSPLSMRELITAMGASSGDRQKLRKNIRQLESDGEIVRIRGARYGLPEKMNLVTGLIQGHEGRFGFLIPDRTDEADVFLGARNFDGAMHGDRAVVRIESTRSDGRREGNVIRVLERRDPVVPGIFESYRQGGFVVPADGRIVHDIFIPPEAVNGAKNGQAVIAHIEEYPSRRARAAGSISKVLGDPDDPNVEVAFIVSRYGLRTEFPRAAVREAKRVTAPGENDLVNRLDLRKRDIVTIDGESARDFDDAVEVERLAGGKWRLGVHIADVSHYVREGTALDTEAVKRGNSTYFPGSVIPMLPFELSNDICSLNPKVDRLTMSCIMTFDRGGRLLKTVIDESIIRSKERMTYTDVAKILDDKDQATRNRYASLVPMFEDMGELAVLLRAKRLKDGAIDFDLPEPEILLDVTGRPENIIRRERNSAHRLIEEFMLSANRAVAAYLGNTGNPTIYRVHAEPDQLKIETFKEFLSTFGLRYKANQKLTGKEMQKIQQRFANTPEEKLITTVMLRSMMQARYSIDNIGHFGLGFDNYTHFTSPIRRYPDLLVHRLLKQTLRRAVMERCTEEVLAEEAASCSITERNSEGAEREIVKLRQTQYMSDFLEEEFDGIISGVTAFGFFVELLEIPVEGLVRLTSMADDYYRYREVEHALLGERTRKRFRLGDTVRIKVTSVNVRRRQIDFDVLGLDSPRGKKTSLRGKQLGLSKRSHKGGKNKKKRRTK